MPRYEKRPPHKVLDTLRTRARQMRRESTVPEILLWSRLRGDQILGLRFRRQYRVGQFILDFFCPQLELAIEVDGESHVDEQYDSQRDDYLNQRGVRVMRFQNDDVLKHLDAVVEAIYQECQRLLKHHQGPLPNPLPEDWERE